MMNTILKTNSLQEQYNGGGVLTNFNERSLYERRTEYIVFIQSLPRESELYGY